MVLEERGWRLEMLWKPTMDFFRKFFLLRSLISWNFLKLQLNDEAWWLWCTTSFFPLWIFYFLCVNTFHCKYNNLVLTRAHLTLIYKKFVGILAIRLFVIWPLINFLHNTNETRSLYPDMNSQWIIQWIKDIV